MNSQLVFFCILAFAIPIFAEKGDQLVFDLGDSYFANGTTLTGHWEANDTFTRNLPVTGWLLVDKENQTIIIYSSQYGTRIVLPDRAFLIIPVLFPFTGNVCYEVKSNYSSFKKEMAHALEDGHFFSSETHRHIVQYSSLARNPFEVYQPSSIVIHQDLHPSQDVGRISTLIWDQGIKSPAGHLKSKVWNTYEEIVDLDQSIHGPLYSVPSTCDTPVLVNYTMLQATLYPSDFYAYTI